MGLTYREYAGKLTKNHCIGSIDSVYISMKQMSELDARRGAGLGENGLLCLFRRRHNCMDSRRCTTAQATVADGEIGLVISAVI